MKLDGTSLLNGAVNSAAPAALTQASVAAGAASLARPQANPAVAAKQAPPEPQKAAQAAQEINDFLKSAAAGIEFQIDSQSERVIVRIVDTETKQLIRQMPSEEMVAISHALDHLTGLLLAQKA